MQCAVCHIDTAWCDIKNNQLVSYKMIRIYLKELAGTKGIFIIKISIFRVIRTAQYSSQD